MGRSEMALLRREMAEIVSENRRLQDTIARMKAESDETRTALEGQIDLLMEAVAEKDRRLAKYENPNAPSSTDSMYNKERDAFRKRMAEEEGWGGDDGAKDGPEPEGDAAGASGPRGDTRARPTATGPRGGCGCACTGAGTADAGTSRMWPPSRKL